MKLANLQKKENHFLSRTEVSCLLNFEGTTPSNAQVLEALSKELKVAPELLVLKHINNKYNLREANVLAYVYDNAAARKNTEPVTAAMKKASGEKKPEEKKEEKK